MENEYIKYIILSAIKDGIQESKFKYSEILENRLHFDVIFSECDDIAELLENYLVNNSFLNEDGEIVFEVAPPAQVPAIQPPKPELFNKTARTVGTMMAGGTAARFAAMPFKLAPMTQLGIIGGGIAIAGLPVLIAAAKELYNHYNSPEKIAEGIEKTKSELNLARKYKSDPKKIRKLENKIKILTKKLEIFREKERLKAKAHSNVNNIRINAQKEFGINPITPNQQT